MSQSLASPVTLPADAVTMIDGHAVTTSLAVAKVFGKRHSHVLRDIETLECSTEFRESNFGLTFQDVPGPNGATRTEPYVNLTRDALAIVAFGYTGRLAMRFKEAYIARFNAMEQALLAPATPESADLLDLLARCQAELLRDPLWSKLVRYHAAELSGRDQASLLSVSETTVRRHQQRMQHCGLLPHPALALSRHTH